MKIIVLMISIVSSGQWMMYRMFRGFIQIYSISHSHNVGSSPHNIPVDVNVKNAATVHPHDTNQHDSGMMVFPLGYTISMLWELLDQSLYYCFSSSWDRKINIHQRY